jgi:hypothetical protein
MAQSVSSMIVDMTTLALTSPAFSTTYTFDNGTALVVSKNLLTGRGACNLASVPLDANGSEEWERAEQWQTTQDVAERLMTLAAE